MIIFDDFYTKVGNDEDDAEINKSYIEILRIFDELREIFRSYGGYIPGDMTLSDTKDQYFIYDSRVEYSREFTEVESRIIKRIKTDPLKLINPFYWIKLLFYKLPISVINSFADDTGLNSKYVYAFLAILILLITGLIQVNIDLAGLIKLFGIG